MPSQSKTPNDLLESPIKLTDNNYTPMSRTPWAGTAIRENYKAHLKLQENIGESWELSFDPSMPSFIEKTNESLYDIAPQLREKFSTNKNKGFNLLIKLISAAKNLSVQMHPDYNSPQLNENECGKHESWYILEAEKNAGIYIGFKENTSIEKIKDSIKNSKDLSGLLNYIPVKKGDFFDIPPGTVHAIGSGVTVLEPQRVLFGKSGITYRLWDWNRKYDIQGKESKNGSPRKLHIKECFKLLTTGGQLFPEVMKLKKKANKIEKTKSKTSELYDHNSYYTLEIITLEPGAEYRFKSIKYCHILILEGSGRILSKKQQQELSKGDSFLSFGKNDFIAAGKRIKFSLISEKS